MDTDRRSFLGTAIAAVIGWLWPVPPIQAKGYTVGKGFQYKIDKFPPHLRKVLRLTLGNTWEQIRLIEAKKGDILWISGYADMATSRTSPADRVIWRVYRNAHIRDKDGMVECVSTQLWTHEAQKLPPLPSHIEFAE